MVRWKSNGSCCFLLSSFRWATESSLGPCLNDLLRNYVVQSRLKMTQVKAWWWSGCRFRPKTFGFDSNSALDKVGRAVLCSILWTWWVVQFLLSFGWADLNSLCTLLAKRIVVWSFVLPASGFLDDLSRCRWRSFVCSGLQFIVVLVLIPVTSLWPGRCLKCGEPLFRCENCKKHILIQSFCISISLMLNPLYAVRGFPRRQQCVLMLDISCDLGRKGWCQSSVRPQRESLGLSSKQFPRIKIEKNRLCNRIQAGCQMPHIQHVPLLLRLSG